MQPPAVSVVVTTFNRPNLLLQTLGSVFSQTYEDFEVVLINDGSNDDTLEQLRPLHRLHGGKLRIISQVNMGIGAARNRGMDEARGKYVALLDHDDLWMPFKLERQVRFLEQHPNFVSVGASYAFSTAPDVPVFRVADVIDSSGEVQHPLRLFADGVYVVLTSFLMFVRERARGLRFATLRGAIEDVPFQVKLFARGPYGMASEEILGIYRRHPGNASSGPDYFFAGVKQLRQMDRDGHFDDITGALRQDMEYYFAQQGRMAAMRQLLGGRRSRAAEMYIREWWPQAKQRRVKFLATFPLLLLSPRAIVRQAEPRR